MNLAAKERICKTWTLLTAVCLSALVFSCSPS